MSAAGVFGTIMAGCGSETPTTEALYRCDSYEVYADSLISKELSLSVRNGEMAVFRNGARSSHPVNSANDGQLSFNGGDTLFTYLFNQPLLPGESCPIYSPTTPYEIILCDVLTDPDKAMEALDRQIKDVGLLFPETNRMQWPVISSDAAWPISAWEVYLATGDRNWFQKTVDITMQILKHDTPTVTDRPTGLFRALPADIAESSRIPTWMDADDIADARSFKSNVERAVCYDILYNAASERGKDGEAYRLKRDSLINAIDTYFWTPDSSRYSEMLYGTPYPIQSPVSDNLAEATGIICGVVDIAMAKAAISGTPVYHTGVPRSCPSAERPDPLTTSLWNIASSHTGNAKTFNLTLASLAYHAAADPACRDYLRAAMLRGIAGISLSQEGMRFSPFVPTVLDGEKTISNLRYRNATLDITINGTGNIVSTFAIDGRPSDGHIIPPSMSGHHKVTITLVGFSGKESEDPIKLTTAHHVPPTLSVNRISNGKALIPLQKNGYTIAYINGALTEKIQGQIYELKTDTSATAVTFVPVSDGAAGFSAPTYLYIPSRDSVSIYLSSIGRRGARSLKDKKLAKQYAESTRFKNSHIIFETETEHEGTYYIQLVYLNGLGIVNPERRYAMRELTVNGSFAGLLVLPQLSPERWSPDADWQSLKGVSLPMTLHLAKGKNIFEISYFAPPFSDFNHDSNTLIPEKIILTQIN